MLPKAHCYTSLSSNTGWNEPPGAQMVEYDAINRRTMIHLVMGIVRYEQVNVLLLDFFFITSFFCLNQAIYCKRICQSQAYVNFN